MTKQSVTLRDVYDIAERLETKFSEKFSDHETRIRMIEKFQNRALGVISFLALFSSLAANAIWDRLLGK